MSIKKDKIELYVRHLANFGCTFKIIEDDGTEHGTLEIVKKKSTRSGKARYSVVTLIDYRPMMKELAVGDVITFTPPAGLPIESLRSAITGYATHKFGKGKFTTAVDKDENLVEVMRLEE